MRLRGQIRLRKRILQIFFRILFEFGNQPVVPISFVNCVHPPMSGVKAKTQRESGDPRFEGRRFTVQITLLPTADGNATREVRSNLRLRAATEALSAAHLHPGA
jgi:hypothetical protein